MQLIPNWKAAHRLWSVRMAALTTTLAGLDWLVPTLSDMIPKWAYVALSASVVAARLIQQEQGHGDR
jgi:hypothetical protein